MVKTVTAFEASDGKIFSSQKQAAEHDAIIQLMKLDIFNTASAQAVVKNAAEIFSAIEPLVYPQDGSAE